MLNSIQSTANYQNSRPNFGMLTPHLGIQMLDIAGDDIPLLKKALELIEKAATNSSVKIDYDYHNADTFQITTFPAESEPILVKKGTNLANEFFDAVELQIQNANETSEKMWELIDSSEAGRLRAKIRALLKIKY